MISDIKPTSVWRHVALGYRSVVLSIDTVVCYRRTKTGTVFTLQPSEFLKAYALAIPAQL